MSERAKIATKNPERKHKNPVAQKKDDISPDGMVPSSNTLFFQRAIGNQGMQELLEAGVIQAKLKILQSVICKPY